MVDVAGGEGKGGVAVAAVLDDAGGRARVPRGTGRAVVLGADPCPVAAVSVAATAAPDEADEADEADDVPVRLEAGVPCPACAPAPAEGSAGTSAVAVSFLRMARKPT